MAVMHNNESDQSACMTRLFFVLKFVVCVHQKLIFRHIVAHLMV